MAGLREAMVAMEQSAQQWAQEVEQELEKSGASVKVTEQTHAQHIAALYARHVATCAEKEALLVKVNTAEGKLLDELRKQATQVHLSALL